MTPRSIDCRVHPSVDTTSVRAVAALDDDLRQGIYAFIRSRRGAVTRQDVAAAMGISRRLAAFHLEKLLERGLLQAHHARPPGRGGPGAGRPAKYYGVSDREMHVSLPERRYEVVGRLLVEAIRTQAPGEGPQEALARVAGERGVLVGREERHRARLRRPGPQRTLGGVEQILERYGFEPYRPSPGSVALANCPFLDLAREAPELVCEMTRSFVEGVIRGLGSQTVQAVLERRAGDCCVSVR